MEANNIIESFIKSIEDQQLTPNINLDRPQYIQPEDRILYRSCRIVLILGMFNTKHGLSKEVIACVDFLLRNTGYQKKFVIEYFKDKQNNLLKKLNQFSSSRNIEMDYNVVQYKSVPWDLRFNDMFLFLKIRSLIDFVGAKPNYRVILNDKGEILFQTIKEIFIEEVNFLELFGKSIQEDKTKLIITDVIPNSYWRENERLNYQ